MQKVLFLSAAFVLCTSLVAQKVTVTKKDSKVKGGQAEGYTTELDGKKEDISAAWTKFLKEIGKVKGGVDEMTVAGPAMGGTVYESGILYATARGNETQSHIWLGIKPDEWKVNDISLVHQAVERLVYSFGVNYYRNIVQKQIDESQRALDAVEKQQQRLINQNKDLVIRLGNSEQEKVQLEKSLESNKLEQLVLQQKIENNKKSQDSVAEAGVQIKKMLEMHREKQRKVN